MNLNSPAIKAFVADFLVTLSASVVLLQFAPTNIREAIDGLSVLGFAAARAGAVAGYRAALKWANS